MTGQSSAGTSLLRRGLALVAGAALAGGVAACSPENIAERVIEAGSDGSVDVNIDDGGGQITIEGEDGGIATFGSDGSLPDSFPDAVPVVSGDIVYSQSMDETGGGSFFNVIITVSGEPDAVWERVKSDLENAGFTLRKESTFSGEGNVFYNADFGSNDWDVSANVSGDPSAPGQSNVAYGVSEATG